MIDTPINSENDPRWGVSDYEAPAPRPLPYQRPGVGEPSDAAVRAAWRVIYPYHPYEAEGRDHDRVAGLLQAIAALEFRQVGWITPSGYLHGMVDYHSHKGEQDCTPVYVTEPEASE